MFPFLLRILYLPKSLRTRSVSVSKKLSPCVVCSPMSTSQGHQSWSKEFKKRRHAFEQSRVGPEGGSASPSPGFDEEEMESSNAQQTE